ncbi:MAG: hypothetical protein KAI74_02240 [Kiritimatiellae bacterium]|nr:hypothetical protein [Kiritimatiellia bacterium]
MQEKWNYYDLKYSLFLTPQKWHITSYSAEQNQADYDLPAVSATPSLQAGYEHD